MSEPQDVHRFSAMIASPTAIFRQMGHIVFDRSWMAFGEAPDWQLKVRREDARAIRLRRAFPPFTGLVTVVPTAGEASGVRALLLGRVWRDLERELEEAEWSVDADRSWFASVW